MRAFHENPNHIYTELTFITLQVHNHKMYFFSSTKIYESKKEGKDQE